MALTMKVRELLTKDEEEEYKREWSSFSRKYELLSPYEVHSGMPVIGQIFQFKDKSLFRTHVCQRKLKRFDPYFLSDKYLHPFWHVEHYFMVLEQLYHAGSNKLRDNSKLVVKDAPEEFKWRKPIFWDKPISVGLILEDLGEKRGYHQERASFTIYEDRKGRSRSISEIDFMTFYQPRAYIRDLEKLKEGDFEILEELVRKIRHQAISHRKMTKPRTDLQCSEEELIEKLKDGEIPEQELHDFFSFWTPK